MNPNDIYKKLESVNNRIEDNDDVDDIAQIMLEKYEKGTLKWRTRNTDILVQNMALKHLKNIRGMLERDPEKYLLAKEWLYIIQMEIIKKS